MQEEYSTRYNITACHKTLLNMGMRHLSQTHSFVISGGTAAKQLSAEDNTIKETNS